MDRVHRRRAWMAAVLILGIMVLSGAGAYAYFREDPALAALRELDQEIADLMRNENPQPDDATVIEALQVVREEKLDALSDAQLAVLQEQRDQQWMERAAQREAQLDERLTAFFALSAADRVARMDQMIAADEALQRAWEERMAAGNGDGNAGQRRGVPGDSGNRPAANGARRGQDRGGRSAWTPERRKQRERQRLDRSTPQHRAQRTEFVRLLQDRRKAQGLPPASMRQMFGMYRQLAAPPAGASNTAAAPARS